MYDVFISYVTPNLEKADDVNDRLSAEGFNTFFDRNSMYGGGDFGESLIQAVKQSRALVFLHSKYANEHDTNIIAEIQAAKDKPIPVIVIKLDDTPYNDKLTYRLNTEHFIKFYGRSFDSCLDELVATLRVRLPKIQKKNETTVEEEIKPTTQFIYDEEYGIMINPADGARNVSFRVDTFIRMMGGIYEKVAEIAGEAAAQDIFFHSGHASGKSFAERINPNWGNGSSLEAMQKKIEKWCEFDSAVGWGKFKADIHVDKTNHKLEGTLTIIEAFIVDEAHRRKVCAFIRGYCTGVLNTLLRSSNIELVCSSCRLEEDFSNECVFQVKMKG